MNFLYAGLKQKQHQFWGCVEKTNLTLRLVFPSEMLIMCGSIYTQSSFLSVNSSIVQIQVPTVVAVQHRRQ